MFVLGLALLACGPVPSDSSGAPALSFDGDPPTNLLFLSIDTLRRDGIGVHGASGVTPFLDQLSTSSLILDDHQQCSSWTYPGTTCAIAGRRNFNLGHAPWLGGEGKQMAAGQPMLADFLEDEGYWTGLVSGNTWLSPSLRNATGYSDFSGSGANARVVRENGLEMWRAGGDGRPWFLHLHHMEPHAPYTPDPSFIVGREVLQAWPDDLLDPTVQVAAGNGYDAMTPADQTLLRQHLGVLYEAEIRSLDAGLEETWAALQAEGMLDDTLVVFWSDHGEQLWDHGSLQHAHRLHSDENDAVAMFWAQNIRPGRHSAPTSAIDLVPTVLSALDLEIPGVVTGEVVGTAAADRPIHAEVLGYDGIYQSVSVGTDKLHFHWETDTWEQFDRSVDRGEFTDVFDVADPVSLELQDLLMVEVERLQALL